MTEEAKAHAKKILLERLIKNFTISSACNAVGIDRKTFYRWSDEDPEFGKQAYENMQESKKDITDIANNRLVHHIQDGNLTAIMYWLKHYDPEVTDKAISMTDEDVTKLSTLLYSPYTFKEGQELLTSFVLRGKISEGQAQFILRMFTAQMKVEDIMVRKTEAEVRSEVLLKKNMKKTKRR
jgi:Helix-turn-helix of insertion element transposase